MPKRTKNSLPKPRKINGNLLGIYVDGGRKTFGQYDDPIAWEKLSLFCRTWKKRQGDPNYAAGCSPPFPNIGDLVAAFIPFAKEHKPNDWYSYRIACNALLRHAKMPTADFDSYLLLEIQNDFLNKDYNRINCNRYINLIIHIFRWGETRRLVPSGKFIQLKAIDPLLPGKGREPHDRLDVPYEIVERTLPYLLPVYQAFIRILMLTGARPSEILRMKVADIERKKVKIDGKMTEIWVFSPENHKTARKNKRRVITFRAKEQSILAPYIATKESSSPIFTPKDAILEHYEKRYTKRTLPDYVRDRLTPQFRTMVVSHALRKAIRRANCELPPEKQIPRWTLYQIRHTFASQAALRLGDEAAALLLGHADPKMLRRRYDHSQEQRITEFKKKLDGE